MIAIDKETVRDKERNSRRGNAAVSVTESTSILISRFLCTHRYKAINLGVAGPGRHKASCGELFRDDSYYNREKTRKR